MASSFSNFINGPGSSGLVYFLYWHGNSSSLSGGIDLIYLTGCELVAATWSVNAREPQNALLSYARPVQS